MQSGRENEARGKTADEIDHRGGAGDVAADDAKRFRKGALDDGQAVRHAVTLRNAAATRAIHADRVDLIEIRHGIEFVGQVANGRDRRHVAIHRIDRFEGDQLGRVERDVRQLRP